MADLVAFEEQLGTNDTLAIQNIGPWMWDTRKVVWPELPAVHRLVSDTENLYEELLALEKVP